MIIPDENYLTLVLMLVTSVVSVIALKNKKVFYLLMFHPASVIQKKEYHRIITSGFVHNDPMHLLVNLFMFFVFCSGLEEYNRGPDYLGLMFIIGVSLVTGHVLSLFVHLKDITYSCAGASGIVTGCLVSYVLYHPYGNNLSFPFMENIPNIFSATIYFVVMIFYIRKFHGGKVDYIVHVGGGIGGVVATLILSPSVVNFGQ